MFLTKKSQYSRFWRMTIQTLPRDQVIHISLPTVIASYLSFIELILDGTEAGIPGTLWGITNNLHVWSHPSVYQHFLYTVYISTSQTSFQPWMPVFTERLSYASAVLGVVILSVHSSVCHTCALWLIQRSYRRYFYTTWKGNPSSFLTPKISAKFCQGHLQRGRQIEVGYLAISHKRCKIGTSLLWNANRNS